MGLRGLTRAGKRRWRRDVARVVEAFQAALMPHAVVLGGGNAKLLKEPPSGCRVGDNANAFEGGFRLWEPEWADAVPVYQDATPPAGR